MSNMAYGNYSTEDIKNKLNEFIEDYMDEKDDGWRNAILELLPNYEPKELSMLIDELIRFIRKGVMFGCTPKAVGQSMDKNGWFSEYLIPLTSKFKISDNNTIEFEDESGEWTPLDELYTE